MTPWQRRARLFVAVFAIGVAVSVGLAVRRRPAVAPPAIVPRLDPSAVVESTAGHVVRVTGTREDVAVDYEKQVTYKDGTSKLVNVKVTTTNRADGRVFTIAGNEGEVTDKPTSYVIRGSVTLSASDGLTAKTAHATYSDASGVVHAPGPIDLAKGRISASGTGLVYDEHKDVATILDKAVVHIAADDKGVGAAEVTCATATFDRPAKIIRFGHDVRVTRGQETTAADEAVAHLSGDEKRIEKVELHGNARIARPGAAAGSLKALTGHDMDLDYAPEGESLQHAVISGGAALQLAGDSASAGRQIVAHTLDIALAPDGETPTSVTGRDAVQLTFPPEQGVGARTIHASTLDAKGEPGKGLTAARFTGNVDYREKTEGGADRDARSNALDVALKPGMSAIDEARFAGAVRFQEGAMTARAAAARYLLDKGLVELTGTEPPPGAIAPHVENDQIAVDAVRIDLTLAGPKMKATGEVRSRLQPPKRGAPQTGTKIPGMLKQDQPVNVTGRDLDYDGTRSTAVYTGDAQLWQADTSVRADRIVVDDKSGDLTATGSATTSTMLEQVNSQTKAKERVRSIGTAKDFTYEDDPHRATYTGDAHLSGPQGDVTAPKIELYLKPSGDELERAEAYEQVTLRESGRKTTGTRMTYFADDERYQMTGAPVRIVDECGGETVGRTLTFDKAADTIVLDGKKQLRTQSKGTTKCG